MLVIKFLSRLDFIFHFCNYFIMHNFKSITMKKHLNLNKWFFTHLFKYNFACLIVIILLPVFHLHSQDGYLDSTFDPGWGIINGQVNAMDLQSDGKIIIGGDFHSFNGVTKHNIARINVDGSVDPTFTHFNGIIGTVSCVKIQDDGKILVAGSFSSYDNVPFNDIVRLNPDGSIDSTFDPGTGSSGDVVSLAIDSNGKIVIGGNFMSFNNSNVYNVVRLNSNGTIDSSFNCGAGTTGSDAINSICIQNDGKILLGGSFYNFDNGFPCGNIVRLNENGSSDLSFNISGAGFNASVFKISIKNDGKILIAGNFTSYNGQLKNRVVQIFSDGTIDNSFNINGAVDAVVLDLQIQPDNKIIISGNFTYVDGVFKKHFARLEANGSFDQSFGNITGGVSWGGTVNCMAIQSDDKILIGGYFITFDGVGRNKIARVNNGASSANIIEFNPNSTISIHPNPASSTFSIEGSTNLIGSNYAIYNQVGELLVSGAFRSETIEIDISKFEKGLYLIRFDNLLYPDQKVIVQ